MTIEIYIVYGMSGEYEDRTEWTVCAYASKKMAQSHAKLAVETQATLYESFLKRRELYFNDDTETKEMPKMGRNPFDQIGTDSDRQDATYVVGKCQFRTVLPTRPNLRKRR